MGKSEFKIQKNTQYFHNIILNYSVYALKPYILSHLCHTPPSDNVASVKLTLCRQPHGMHMQYINTAYHNFLELNLVLYAL